jgi:hypothetical protein
MPPNERAMVLLINGDTATAEQWSLDWPGTNMEELDPDDIDAGSEKLATVFWTW